MSLVPYFILATPFIPLHVKIYVITASLCIQGGFKGVKKFNAFRQSEEIKKVNYLYKKHRYYEHSLVAKRKDTLYS